jgi:gluconokinase
MEGRSQVRLVFLDGSKALIAERLATRTGHFMPPSLLDSQFATLERPGQEEGPIIIPIDLPLSAQVKAVTTALA